jgi:hypothetical protein
MKGNASLERVTIIGAGKENFVRHWVRHIEKIIVEFMKG